MTVHLNKIVPIILKELRAEDPVNRQNAAFAAGVCHGSKLRSNGQALHVQAHTLTHVHAPAEQNHTQTQTHIHTFAYTEHNYTNMKSHIYTHLHV